MPIWKALNNTELQGKKLMVKFADADAEVWQLSYTREC